MTIIGIKKIVFRKLEEKKVEFELNTVDIYVALLFLFYLHFPLLKHAHESTTCNNNNNKKTDKRPMMKKHRNIIINRTECYLEGIGRTKNVLVN